jgi:hypothetical protein
MKPHRRFMLAALTATAALGLAAAELVAGTGRASPAETGLSTETTVSTRTTEPTTTVPEERPCTGTLSVTVEVRKNSDINGITNVWSFDVVTKKGIAAEVTYNFAFSGNRGGGKQTQRAYGPVQVGRKGADISVKVVINKPTEHDSGPNTGGVIPDDVGKSVSMIDEKLKCPDTGTATKTVTKVVAIPANPKGGTPGLEQDAELAVTVVCSLDP